MAYEYLCLYRIRYSRIRGQYEIHRIPDSVIPGLDWNILRYRSKIARQYGSDIAVGLYWNDDFPIAKALKSAPDFNSNRSPIYKIVG